MSNKEVLIDTATLQKLSNNGRDLNTFKSVLTDLEFHPVVHPYIASNELDMQSYFKELVSEGAIRVAEYSEFLPDKNAKELYEAYFIDIHNEIRKNLEAVGSRKKLDKLDLPKGQTVFSYRKAQMSLGDVHIILMAFFMQMPIILTEDSDIKLLRSITRRKMASDKYNLAIYNAVDLLRMIAEKEDTTFSKNQLIDIVKRIGERAHQAEIKQAWNAHHQNT